jgi:hypothetical protein
VGWHRRGIDSDVVEKFPTLPSHRAIPEGVTAMVKLPKGVGLQEMPGMALLEPESFDDLQRVPEDCKEKVLQSWVRKRAEIRGWICWCTLRSEGSPPGQPDLILVRPPRVVFAELKSAKGRLTEAQIRAGSNLEGCPGVEYFLWRPKDQGEIIEVLKDG